MAPTHIGLGRLLGGRSLFAFAQFDLVELGTQHLPGGFAVLMLRALAFGNHLDLGRLVDEAHGRFHLVDVLATCAARAHGLRLHIGGIEVDLDRIIHHGVNRNAGKAGVAAGVGIIGRNAHQPMHARLRLQPAESIAALDLDGGGFDASLFAIRHIHQLDLETAPLTPAAIHAKQHVGPILAFGAARPRMHLQERIHAIGFARQHRFDLLALRFLLQATQQPFTFQDGGFVALDFAQFDQHRGIVEIALQLADAIEA